MKRPVCFFVAVVSLFLLTGAASKRRSVRSTDPPIVLSLQRSFAISDKPILEGFRFERVLNALAERSNVPGMTGEKLFRQWFDVQNPKPGLDASMPHCNDETTNGKATMNGFSIACPADGGFLATAPFQPDSFLPILITNRFDQAGGASCGQYRIAYALQRPPLEVFHVIFEGALPNPDPARGVAACRPVAQFWANLSAVGSVSERRARLEQFFFDGIDGFALVVHPDHYHAGQAGIRTLQLTTPKNLLHFFQYRLIHDCGQPSCTLVMKPDLLENTTFGALFDARTSTPMAQAFRADFIKQIKTLVIPDVNLFSMQIPATFLVPDTQPSAEEIQPSFIGAFDQALSSTPGQDFRLAIGSEAFSNGSRLTTTDIITRVQTLTCTGCHFGNVPIGDGLQFPLALRDFQHVTEDQLIAGEAGPATRYNISSAMQNVFIPHRMKILSDFLATGKAPVHSN